MTSHFILSEESLKNSLLVFALESEAAGEFDEYEKLLIGIGKVNAAYELTRRIYKQRPQLIINLGSAGSNIFKKGEVVCCSKFVQRDMDIKGLGFAPYETPFSGLPPVLEYGLKLQGVPGAVCGTGDSFEMNHSSPDYTIVDMEAFPLALIAMKENIPFLCLKYISDGADGAAANDWTVEVHNAARALRSILKNN